MNQTTEDGRLTNAGRERTAEDRVLSAGRPALGGDSSATGPLASVVSPPARQGRIWLWVVVAFAIQLAVWTGWIVFASHHRVEEVPLATAGDRR